MRTLIELAKEVLVEEDRQSTHKIQRLVQLGSRGAREIGIDITTTAKTVFLTPNSYGCIDAPEDMQNWTKVAVCHGGYLYTLSQNNDLCFPHMVDDCGNLEKESVATPADGFSAYADYSQVAGFGVWFYNVTAVNEYGELNAKLFGYGAGYNRVGYFKFNPERNQFLLSPEVQNKQIALEYIPRVGANGAQIMVPDEATETMINFMRWKAAKTIGERNDFKNDYYTCLIQLQQRSFSFSQVDFIRACRTGYHQAAKA